MGYLPRMPHTDGIRKTVQLKFGGYDRSAGSGDGTLCNTENLTADEFPALCSRGKRRYKPVGEIAALCDIDGVLLRIEPNGNVYYGSSYIAQLELPSSEKTVVQFGRNAIILPDKLMLNLAYKICGCYETIEELTQSVLTPLEGDAYLIGGTPGTASQWEMVVYAYVDGQWQENGKFLQRMESSTQELFVTFKNGELYGLPAQDNTIYCADFNWADYFEVGDAVQISGCVEVESNNKIAIVREIDGNELRFYENTFTRKRYPALKGPLEYQTSVESQDDTAIIYAFVHEGVYHTFTLANGVLASDTLVLQDSTAQILHWYRDGNLFSEVLTQQCEQGVIPEFHQELFFEDSFEGECDERAVVLKRTMPDLDFCFADENRLWGVKGSTIYASKLGDPRNFYTFEGLSTDSYSLTVQTPGEFTAAFCYAGYPTFFKEDRISKIYGSAPQNYQLSEISATGVKKGCEKSLAIAADTLFYLSHVGVMAYSGSYPESVSAQLGAELFHESVAGSDGLRYYCCMRGNGAKTLYIFDSRYGIWLRERECSVRQFVKTEGNLYMLERTDGDDTENLLWKLGSVASDFDLDSIEEGELQSIAEFGDIAMQQPNRKTVHRVQLRIEAEIGTEVGIFIRYDSQGNWHLVRMIMPETKHSFYLPVMPRRCDHFRLKIVGTGRFKISSLALEVRTGSEIF